MRKGKVIKYCFDFIVGLIVSMQILYAQDNSDSVNVLGLNSFLKFKISWYGGLEWEKKISKVSVINLFAGAGVGRQTVDLFDLKARVIISPVGYAEYRNYYNFFKRISNNKKTVGNAANFLFGRAETILGVRNQNYFNLILGQGWGAQRLLNKRIIVDCHLGIAEHFFFDKPPGGRFHNIKLDPLAEFSISYLF